MSALIFKVCLPLLLGYTLFVGLSGRFIPFIRPAKLTDRPSWFIGLWTGLVVSIGVGVSLHMAYQLPLEDIKMLAKPIVLLLATAMVPGLMMYKLYKRDVRKETRDQDALSRPAEELTLNPAIHSDSSEALDASTEYTFSDEAILIDVAQGHEQAFNLDFDDTLVTISVEEPATAEDVATAIDTATTTEAIDTVTPKETAESAQTLKTIDDLSETSNSITVMDNAELDKQLLDEQRAVAHHLEQQLANERRLSEEQSREQATVNAELEATVVELKRSLEAESQLRTHTETHLRITRKALKNLEGDTRSFETDKADALLEIEEQLEAHVKQSAAAVAHANREESLRIATETTIVNMKQDLLSAKRELRRNTEARAKALSTANKSVAFARQSVQTRTRVEARIKQLESRLKLSQETVSSLIAALDKEKARTQNDVTEMAKELILQQKRLDEKRTLDEAERRTQKRLTHRTTKKVS